MVRYLEGKVAIITGAGHGLGRSYALELAREGALGIVVNDIGVGLQENHKPSSEAAEETVQLVKNAGADAFAVYRDCSQMSAGKYMVEESIRRWGRLDIVVNNAGNIRDRMIFNMTEEDWDSVIRVHLKGHFVTTKHACEYWRREFKIGRPVSGRIINTSSSAGLFGNAGQPNYAAAKAGIVGYTLALAFSMSRYNVTANAIAPGADTDSSIAIDGASQEFRDAMKPEYVSPVVAFLASDAAAEINGRIFQVLGGRIDYVTHHELVKAVKKQGEPWKVEEIEDAFKKGVLGSNPEPLQAVFRDLTEDLVG